MFDQQQRGQGRGGGGFPYMPVFSPWYFAGRMLGAAPQEKVDHNWRTQFLIPCLRALMGGGGLCLIIVSYVAASYVWHQNITWGGQWGNLSFPLLVFGLPAAISAVIGIFNAPPEKYVGSRQSFFLLFGIASAALCWTFGEIAVRDPEGVLFWEIVKTSCFVGLATIGFLLAIWGIVEQLIVYQMSESQRVGWSVIRGRLDDKIDTGPTATEAEEIEVIKEWSISFVVAKEKTNGQRTRPATKNLYFDPEIIGDDFVAYWAATVLETNDIGYPTWVDSGECGRIAYDHLMQVLRKAGFVAQRGRARNAKLFLTVEGKRALAQWLAAYDAMDRMIGQDEGEGTLADDPDSNVIDATWTLTRTEV